jgi:hypothetical protein
MDLSDFSELFFPMDELEGICCLNCDFLIPFMVLLYVACENLTPLFYLSLFSGMEIWGILS